MSFNSIVKVFSGLNTKVGSLLIILPVLLVDFINSLLTLFKFPVPVGIDGYYYIQQITWFNFSNHFYYHTNTPIVLIILTLFSEIGFDPVFSVKIVSSLFYALLILFSYLIINGAVKNSLVAMLGCCILLVSTIKVFWIVEYVSNLGGIALMLSGFYFLLRHSQSSISKITVFLLFTLAIFSHKSILPLILLISVSYLSFYILTKTINSYWFWLSISLLFISWLLYPFLLKIDLISNLSPLVEPSIAPYWQFPLLVRPFFEEKFLLLIIAPLAFIFSLVKAREKRELAMINGTLAILTIFVTFNPFLNYTDQGNTIPDRLNLLMHLQIAFLISLTIELFDYSKPVKIIILGAALCFLFLETHHPSKGINEQFIINRMRFVDDLKKNPVRLSEKSIIIAPHGFQFAVTSVLGIRSQKMLSAAENEDTYWLIFGVPCEKINTDRMIISREGKTCAVLSQKGNINGLTFREKTFILSRNSHLVDLEPEEQDLLLPESQSTVDLPKENK